jgi:predicted MFS family arabinose efflux permease
LTGRLVTALGAASGLSCTFILINESLPSHWIKHAMAFTPVSFSVGIGLAVSIGGLVTQYLTWQDCFWLLLAHGLLMLLLTGLFQETLKKPLTLKLASILSNYLAALKSHQLVVFSLVVGLSAGLAYTYSAAAPIYAQTTLQLSPSQYGYWNLTSILGMLLSGFLSALLMKKRGIQQTLILGFSLMLLALISLVTLAITNDSSVFWFFITTMLLYLFSGLLFGPASYFASNAISDRASASAMMSFTSMASATLSVVIMGYLPLSAILSFTVILSVYFIVVACPAFSYLSGSKKLA